MYRIFRVNIIIILNIYIYNYKQIWHGCVSQNVDFFWFFRYFEFCEMKIKAAYRGASMLNIVIINRPRMYVSRGRRIRWRFRIRMCSVQFNCYLIFLLIKIFVNKSKSYKCALILIIVIIKPRIYICIGREGVEYIEDFELGWVRFNWVVNVFAKIQKHDFTFQWEGGKGEGRGGKWG